MQRRPSKLLPSVWVNICVRYNVKTIFLQRKNVYARKIGDVGAILQYMQEKQADDKSFYYAIQFDDEDQVTNVFWADGKSMVDYYHFSDVICWDMTYRTSSYGRPFAPFYGVNHHKQIVFFGAALLYDESEESFKWLLTTFKEAMSGKQPTVILTDHDEAIVHATASVWQDTTYCTCVWHVYHNANKYLAQIFQGSRTFAYDFSSLVFDCEDEEEFISSWGKMLGQYDLNDNPWLNQLFKERKKWALPYRRGTFCADMRNIQRRENLNSMLKDYLGLKQDLLQFFKHYERIVDEHRQAEVHADFHAAQSASLMVPSRMLRQAANAYTPAVLDMFQKEFEMSLDCMVYRCGEHGTTYEYKVTSDANPTKHSVKFDSLNGTVVCSCKKFKFLGIQCRHALKVLDILNIKELPAQYLLKRWRKDAKVGSLRADPRFASDIDSNSSKAHRSSYLHCIFSIIAARATHTVEGYAFIENQLDQLTEDVYHVLQTRLPKELQLH
ncbi:protein FAR1-RELATED SEQUENCE 5-like [Iris pallida]|uniref:Protein FAR1-RELATED SEQUENCE n=1 Tax=Iris pallida TaxID=29817 RepID=A0AAX6GNN8_IRIPA|nr:protein FAR1-RELATED SEQUENCE 5-like [Iris pallida]